MNENTYLNKKLNIAIYTDDAKEHETYKKILKNIDIILFLPTMKFDILNKVSLIIILKNNNELIKYCNDNNIIIFSNINKKSSNVYFNDTNILIKYLELLQSNTIIFNIIIPIVSTIDKFKKTLKTILIQPINNYKIQVCIYESIYNENIYILTEFKNIFKINYHIVNDNSSKYININSIVKSIDSEYFMIIDSGSKFMKNKLLYDFINIKINNNDKYYIIQNKCIINDNDKSNKTKKVSIVFSEKNIIFKTKILKKIGYFCNNNFSSDKEYLIRAKYFIGNEYIYSDNTITLSLNPDDNLELSDEVNFKEKEFLNMVNKIIKKIPNTKLYFNKNFDYFDFSFDTSDFINQNEKNQVNFDQYKNFYYDLDILNDFELSKHWLNIGKDEGRLSNENIFYKSFPNFDCLDYMENNKYNIKFETIQYVMGWVYLKNKSSYLKWLKNKKYIKNILLEKKIKNKTFVKFEEYISKYKIKYLHVSEKASYLKKRLINKFNLIEYNKLSYKFENTLFIGMFNKNDYMLITQHIGYKYLMWEGNDIYENNWIKNDSIEKIFHYNNIIHLSVSNNIYDVLYSLELNSINIHLNIVDTNIFKPIDNIKQYIYIYNGEYQKNNETNETNEKYGEHIYENIVKILPEYEYIFSNKLDIVYEKLPEIYSKCFIGLNLTNYNGIDYIIQEMNSMNIPMIYNGIGGIKWLGINDIIMNIRTQNKFVENNNLSYKKNNSDDNIKYFNTIDKLLYYNEVIECDFFNENINIQNLEKIYKNIDNFIDLFKDIKNILFICGDYPGYGGAATNCNDIQTFFNNKNYNTYAIYFNYQYDINKKYHTSNNMKIIEQIELTIELNKLNFKPDIIILKSNIDINLKKIFNCPIFFLIPGIFNNSLNKHYLKLKHNEYEEYINHNILLNIKNYDVSFTNSLHTKKILLNNYKLKTYLFYSGFIKYHNNYNIPTNNFNNRKYTYGIIASDFTRKIKNIEYSINTISELTDVILIGKNSEKYKQPNFTCIENIVHENIAEYYKNIKYIIQDCYYESCSNVKIEAFMNGCRCVNSSHIKKLQIIIKPIETKNILFICYCNKNENDKINTIIEISNIFTDINIYILIVTNDLDYINFINIQQNVYVYELNNNDNNNNLNYFIEKKYEKIYLFDYELPLILNNIFPKNKYIICLLNNDKYNIEKYMLEELSNYHCKTINYDELNIIFCYKLVNSLHTYDNNKYMKYNIDNKLLNTLIIFNYNQLVLF
jgi:hypothetical protein